MRKLTLAVIGLYGSLLSCFSQTTGKDSTAYKSRKLSFEEVNFISSYYRQNGNNSAVTGGIGTEKLNDLSNTIELKLKMYDRQDRKHNLNVELGLDHYSSASSDKIDPSTISSASSADNRFYPSATWTMENEKTGSSVGGGLSLSTEYDYISYGSNLSLTRKTKNKSAEFTLKLQAYLDQVSVILPVELRGNPPTGIKEGRSKRNTYSAAFSYTQIVNQQLQVAFLLDLVYQEGFLGLPFHRIYFSDDTESIEKLPGRRFKLPFALRANYFAGDKFILRSFYRFYNDDWGLIAHTINLEIPWKVNPFISISPFYRFYHQQQVDYFAAYKKHHPAEAFYTSNYDLSTFDSHFYGAGIRLAPPEFVFGINHLASLELRYGHYRKNIGMQSDIISMHLGFK
jgi:hypothetical protein